MSARVHKPGRDYQVIPVVDVDIVWETSMEDFVEEREGDREAEEALREETTAEVESAKETAKYSLESALAAPIYRQRKLVNGLLGLANFDPDKPIADRQDAIGRLRNKYILYQPQLLALLEGFEDMAKAWRVWERNHVALREVIKLFEPTIALRDTLAALKHNLKEEEAKLRRKEERVELREEKLQQREEKIDKRHLELDLEENTP